MVMMPHSRLKSWNEQHNCQPDLPPGLDFIKTAACIIEQLQLQLQLQLQGLHDAFFNVNKRIFNFSYVLQAWWKYVDNESY